MNNFARHPRRLLAWLCIAASLWMGAGFQLHGLAHSLESLQSSQKKAPLPAHAPLCEQCLVFASTDGAAPPAFAALLPPAEASAPDRAPATPTARPAVFTAYASRAPPLPG